MSREKRSIALHGHRTSVAVETEFWRVIDQHILEHGLSLAGLISRIDDRRIEEKSDLGLSAYLRVWVLKTVLADDDRSNI